MSTNATPHVGQVEQRGIDAVPTTERHGRPRDLFWMWLGTNTNVFYIINGAILISLGLSFFQGLLVILLGNLAFFLVGLTSLQGPRAGTATFAINRASFGPHGGRLLAFFNWLTVVGFEGSGIALAVIALLTLANVAALPFSDATWFKVVVILLVAALQFSLPALGHATIMVVQKWLAAVFVVFFVLVAIFVGSKFQVTGGPVGSFATITVGIALMISAGGISWANTGSDYSRYLPAKASPKAIFWWASLGGFIPAVLLEVLGAAVASQLPTASDPISGLPSALPAGFLVLYLLLLLVNLLAVNTIDLYSSGLTLQVIGLRIKRWQATLVDLVICAVLAAVAIFSSNFNTLYSQFLAVLILFLAPWCAIYLVDAWMRRNTYDAEGLLARVGGPYWYQGGISLAGVIALFLGMMASALWLNSPLLQGVLSKSFDGSDLSVFTGLLVGGLAYWGLVKAGLGRSASAPAPETAATIHPGTGD